MTALPLNDAVAPLGFLLGSWTGEGRGTYPTIADFDYGEEITLTHIGKPFLAYRQRTWALDDGRPLHSESGYLRVGGPEEEIGWPVEAVLAHPTGVVEVEVGRLTSRDGIHALTLRSSTVAGTPTAKEVTALRRRLRVDAGVLEYEVDMAAVDQPLVSHLRARLERSLDEGAP